MEVVDGNKIASQIIEELKEKVCGFSSGIPKVLFFRVGEDPASTSYLSLIHI